MRIIGIVIAIVGFLLLVLGHEFGHFSLGKLLGFKINEFSIGMGPRLWFDKKGETEYSLRAVPLGGYCAFEGENGDEAEDENGNPREPDPRGFNRQPSWKKLLVLFAGPFNNFVIGILIFTILFTFLGNYSRRLSSVVEGSPAQKAGILSGDTIIGIDGNPTETWSAVVDAIDSSEGDTIAVRVNRDGQELDFSVQTYINEYEKKAVGIICTVEHNPGIAFKTALSETTRMIRALRDFFVRLFSGNASSNDVGSIIQVVAVSGDYAVNYGLSTVIYLIALVSVNLGFMNLLPIPGLDGGRILFVLIRIITRGKLPEKVENTVNSVFMIILVGLMILLMVKDVVFLVK